VAQRSPPWPRPIVTPSCPTAGPAYFILLSVRRRAHLPALPSFPTRRSSDLPDMPQPDTASPGTENPYLDKPDTEKPAELNIEKSDRKSTRLNSSHVSISYAVFCLKKKAAEPDEAA